MQPKDEATRYLKSCSSEFWQKVFKAELGYLLQHLKPGDKILSVGCGPAFIENGLVGQGFSVTGLDVSREALSCAPDAVRTVVGLAEELPFSDASFDVVLYIASLQFIEDYQKALEQTARVIRPGGKMIVMLLNPASQFFTTRYANVDSYVRKLKHTDLRAIEQAASTWLKVQGEYFLGIRGEEEELFENNDPATAALYVLIGQK